MDKPILSICIPTMNRAEIMLKLLDSIYKSNVSDEDFEVCISDNSDDERTKIIVDSYRECHQNIIYNYNRKKGFYNSIEALKLGKGQLLKLHNDYSFFINDGLCELVNICKSKIKEKPCIYFGLGNVRKIVKCKEYPNLNDFLFDVGIWSTWSSGFTIWHEDFVKLMSNDIKIDSMFPHTSLLFNIYFKNKYIIDNSIYCGNANLKSKGGYNLFDNFIRIYHTLIKDILVKNNYINNLTYIKLKFSMVKFCAKCKAEMETNTLKYTFTYDNYKSIIINSLGFIYLIIYYIFYNLYKFKRYIM